MAVTGVVGDYLKVWFISFGSVFAMLFVCMVVAEIADESMVTLFVLFYNGTVGIFIVLCLLPVGIFIIIAGLLYNMFSPIVAPIVQVFLDLYVQIFSGFFETIGFLDYIIEVDPIVPSSIDLVEAMISFNGLVTAFAQYLLDTSGVPGTVTFPPELMRTLPLQVLRK